MSNAIGILLIAVFQGIVGLAGYLVLGVKKPLFWFIYALEFDPKKL